MYFIYTKNHPIVLLLTPLLVFGYLFAQSFIYPHAPTIEVNFNWFGVYLIDYQYALIANTLLISLNAILINWIFNKNEFLDRNTYVPALIYITLVSFFDSTNFLSGATLAQTGVLLALSVVYALNQQDDARKKSFNMGFFVGIAICLSPEYMPIALLSFFLLWTFRTFRFKEFILLLAGIITPLIYALFINLFLNNLSINDVYIHVEKDLYRNIIQYLPIGITVISMLFAWAGVRERLQNGTVRLRRMFKALNLLLLLGLFYLVTDLFFTGEFNASVIITIPITFGLSLAVTHKKLSRFTLPFLYILLLLTMFKFFAF